MKGKIAFVLGAAVGYVLGTRAGRERYEQIKRGARKVWETEPVQKGVDLVRDVAQTRVDEVKAVVTRAGKGAFAALINDSSSGASRSAGSRARPAESAGSPTGSGSTDTPKGSGSTAAPKSSASADTPKTAGVENPDGDAEDESSRSGDGAA